MKNEKIISALDSVVLSEEASQRIYENVVSEKTAPCRRVSKRFVAVLAAVLVIVLAAGTVAATVIISGQKKYEYTIVDMEGNVSYGSAEYTEDTDSQEDVYNLEWLKNNSSYTVLAIESNSSSTSFSGLCRNVYDYDELKALIPDESLLQLPQYVPEGFEFSEAYIGLYLTEEDVSNASKIGEAFMSEGSIYQCYQFPESIEDNIECVTVVYVNADGEQIKFMSMLVSGFVGISTQKDVKVTTPYIKGFEKALCTVDSERTYCAAQNSIELDAENYVVYSKDVEKEELIKMLESLKTKQAVYEEELAQMVEGAE